MTIALWRIAADTPAYTADDLSGAGAKATGGRWNREGIPAVYASASIALACLETLVNLGASALPLNRYLVRVDVPDYLFERRAIFENLAAAGSRVGWEALPAGRVSLDLGSDWAVSRASAILEVPSAVVEEERNFLVNPAHPDAEAISATKVRRFVYDARLAGRPAASRAASAPKAAPPRRG